MSVLESLQPQNVFKYFEELCAIPHGSHNTKAISDYLVKFAKEHKLKVRQDSLNNVIIWKDATKGYEDVPGVILQGHMDMVCEKLPGIEHDFEKDGLELCVDGDFIRANGTTLGGDDGIAVAYALAILDDESLEHPALEAVFTVDEEVGMDGAMGLDCSDIKGRILLNMDSEGEGVFLAGCAGGAHAAISFPVVYEWTEAKQGVIVVDQLRGGHSGAEIHRQRGNASVLLARVMDVALNGGLCRLVSIKGGSKDNAIPFRAEAKIAFTEDKEKALTALATLYQETFRNELKVDDPEVRVRFLTGENPEMGDGKPNVDNIVRTIPKRGLFHMKDRAVSEKLVDKGVRVMTTESAQRALAAINVMPNGIITKSRFIPNLIETSLNLGVMDTTDDAVQVHFSVRSGIQSEKEMLLRKLQLVAAGFGGSFVVDGNYPAWPYNSESALRDKISKVYLDIYGKRPEITTIHAGVECGLLSDKMPGLDAVSFGPDIFDIHTPAERLSISSAARVYEFVCEVLRTK